MQNPKLSTAPAFLAAALVTFSSACSPEQAKTAKDVAAALDCPEVDPRNDTATPNVDSGPLPNDTGTHEIDTAEPSEPTEIPDNSSLWPASDALGANMASALISAHPGFEASGIDWSTARETYFIAGDDGDLAEMDSFGYLKNYWTPGGDLEGLAVSDASLIYLADERENRLFSFNPDSGEISSGCTIEIPTDPSSGRGLEALAFLPSSHAPEEWSPSAEGYLIAGSQSTRQLSVYSATDCTADAHLSAIAYLDSSNDDVSALHYDPVSRRLLIVHDSTDQMDLLRIHSNEVIWTYELPTGSSSREWEGVLVNGHSCDESNYGFTTLVLTDDREGSGGIYFNGSFPTTCQDEAL